MCCFLAQSRTKELNRKVSIRSVFFSLIYLVFGAWWKLHIWCGNHVAFYALPSKSTFNRIEWIYQSFCIKNPFKYLVELTFLWRLLLLQALTFRIDRSNTSSPSHMVRFWQAFMKNGISCVCASSFSYCLTLFLSKYVCVWNSCLNKCPFLSSFRCICVHWLLSSTFSLAQIVNFQPNCVYAIVRKYYEEKQKFYEKIAICSTQKTFDMPLLLPIKR